MIDIRRAALQLDMGWGFAVRLGRVAGARAALRPGVTARLDRRRLALALLELASNVLSQAEDQLEPGDHAQRLEGISRDVAQLCADMAAED